ncbi:glycosyltransferase family 4 protein [Pelagibacterium sp. H642]|uniref:glycosyltransferase family 4 protein n=1 Tax=Pelagibacterium sp. H642 TaxID=1881069 RepID=UPI00281590C7|nr:glycosyltransferase family 4 protein [Pelagibacterium sp. H642]WMT92645.1 glycosyltransferase family 4 protein [Pelagibacterium sp. H642]
MKFLFNATTNIGGGGAKNSAVFIRQAIRLGVHEWHFAVSPQVAAIINDWNLPNSDITIISESPARSVRARRALKQLQANGDFDLVFTMAGPAYVQFSCPHVMGISNPYVSHVDLSTFLLTRSPLRWLPDALRILYQSYHARKADRLIFQTATARKFFCGRLLYPIDRTAVVPNAFDADVFSDVPPPSFETPVVVLVPAMAYPHKLLDQVPVIASLCGNLGDRNVEFHLTLDPGSSEWDAIANRARKLGVAERVRTLGVYNYVNAANVFNKCDIVLSLSVLETFSATPLEAFGAARPHITADRAWSREICGDAALYVEPRDPEAVARTIHTLIADERLRRKMIAAGKERLRQYSDQSTRFLNLIRVLEQEIENCRFKSGV